MRNMVILAGGDNARMEALRGTVYKAFLPIHGSSLIARHILRASLYGIDRVDVIVDADDPVLSVLAAPPSPDGMPLPAIRILVHEGPPGHKLAWWSEAERSGTDPWIAALGDSLAAVDFDELWGRALRTDVDSAIALAPLRLPVGAAEAEGDRISGFTEKVETHYLVNTGYMVLGPVALARLRDGVELHAVLEGLAADGLLGQWTSPAPMFTVNSLSDLGEVHRLLA